MFISLLIKICVKICRRDKDRLENCIKVFKNIKYLLEHKPILVEQGLTLNNQYKRNLLIHKQIKIIFFLEISLFLTNKVN